MAEYDDLPTPEPKEIDEKNWILLGQLAERAVLRGAPNGEEKCSNCMYYTDHDELISYCWHPQLRILVGAGWWCQWWEAIPDE
jgi:hypothetical protein